MRHHVVIDPPSQRLNAESKLPSKPIKIVVIQCAFALLACAAASADVQVRVREASWSIGRAPSQVETVVETSIRQGMRRVESETIAVRLPGDSLVKGGRSVQIDRVDRDSSYYFRPGEGLYLPVALSVARSTNLRGAEAFRAAQANGTAPRDTLAGVKTIELGRTRTILGEPCRGIVLELVFSYRDSATATAEQLTGVLTDTLWMTGASSPLAELRRFEQDFARVTASDSFLVAASAVQLTQVRGQGLVSVLQRAVRSLPGYPLESTFVNLLHGLPKGLSLGDAERRPDGAVIVQRTTRRAIALTVATLEAAAFEVPAGLKAVNSGRP